ncbi:MAG: hypothetical protein HHJ14_08425 [Cellulomonas sp.]|nr:hypothetical protein [Cellulomonas sp.]
MSTQTRTAEQNVDLSAVRGEPVDLDGRRFYQISAYDQIPPFFMTVVGASNLWLFISSTGGVTAGREHADRALFPYYTEDKVAEGAGRTGGLTVLRVGLPDASVVCWQPFAETRPGDPAVERNLAKDFLGTTLVFEETRADLGLRLRVSWQTSARYGVVRSCELLSVADGPRSVEILDGFVNLLPAGTTVQAQNELSALLDAYKRTEVDDATGLGILYLSSTLTDKAEPSESLRANVAWHVGLGRVDHLLSARQIRAFAAGDRVTPDTELRGERGAYLVRSQLVLAAGEQRGWSVVADADLDAAQVVALQTELADSAGVGARLAADIERTRTDLEALIATSDAAQLTGDELAAAHHSANVLFNSMRGGVPSDGYAVDAADFRLFVTQRSPRTAQRCASVLAGLPERLPIDALVALAEDDGDPDLWRLAREYLPLTFSRRHGDPSRPWNVFRIALHDERGKMRVDFQGNWRDIFQNWEALAWSFPEYVESMVVVFLDASTADGYNPYRISRAGIDWEVPEPGNPWSNIGYWSDHQIVYLLKLIETSERFHPGVLAGLVNRPVLTHGDVPYRISSYDQTLLDPGETITFDEEAAAAIARRVAVEGADGKLVHRTDGELVRVTLGEKLLLLVLAKLVNLVPEGGIWMNTQRPEWNDANNALVGRGLSVVTLAYVRRYLGVVRELLAEDLSVTAELRCLLTNVHAALAVHADGVVAGFDDASRRSVMDALGAAGTAYRTRVYAGFGGNRATVDAATVRAFLDLAKTYVDSGLRANRRADALFHSYNLLELREGATGIRRLQVMLEGQVAILSSGLLGPHECLGLLNGLRTSALYRPDQHSYMLYPDQTLPRFLERNLLSAGRAAGCPLVGELVRAGDTSIVLQDVGGDFRFARDIHNAGDVTAALAALPADVVVPEVVERGRAGLLAVFEDVFQHAEFTGRSGSFFAYEGLGSIYWHMVSKLLLAVQENVERAVAEGADATDVDRLRDAYEDVRIGLGYSKTPEVYGAFPVDPYSHTPAGRGARQPGMTGQVKEEVLTRLGELGLRVEHGRITFRPVLLRPQEWTTQPETFRYLDVAGKPQSIDLDAGSLAFTFCQVPVVYRRRDRSEVRVDRADGAQVALAGGSLDADLSARVFQRLGDVVRIVVDTPAG